MVRCIFIAAAWLASLCWCVDATCKLPIHFPARGEPSGATIGPSNSLIIPSDSGSLLFVNLDDYSVREDTALNDKYRDAYGWFDLEGIAMTNPESTFLYVGMENKAAILEFEWHSSHRIFRKFSLPAFERMGDRGMESLTWVPSQASHHQGYFYVGSEMTGHVFIYELPLLDETGPEASGRLISIWTPLRGNNRVSGLTYSAGYIFANYNDGTANHVMIFPILADGLPGELQEQYEVDVTDAEGIAVRKTDALTWEVFFTSDKEQSVFVYVFRFETGFEWHKHCRGVSEPSPARLLTV